MRDSRAIDTLMFRLLTVTMAAVIHAAPRAQTDQNETILAPIVRTERAGAGLIRVHYDLRGAAGTLYAVSLEASTDGGQTFSLRPRAVTGDVGAAVSAGAGKAIAWDTSKDVDDLQTDRFVFRVVVSPAVQGAAPNAPARAATSAPAGGSGEASKPSGGTATAAKKGGGLSRAAILALAGGGAAAGVGVAVAKKDGGSGSPATSVPTGPRTLTAPLTGTLVLTFSNGCSRTEAETGSLRLDLQIAANGSVTGTGSVNGTSTTTVANVGCSLPVNTTELFGGSALVTGTIDNFGFRSTFTNIPPSGLGTNSQDYTFSGSLTGSVVTGTLVYMRTIEPGTGKGTVTFAITAR